MKQTYKELSGSAKDLEQEKLKVQDEIHNLEQEKDRILKSEDYKGYLSSKEEKERLSSRLKQLKDKFHLNFILLEKNLKKTAREMELSAFIENYIANSIDALLNDEKLKILDVLEKTKQNLDHEDKKQKKISLAIEGLDKDYLSSIKEEYLATQEAFGQLKDLPEEYPILKGISSKLQLKRQELEKLESQLKKINDTLDNSSLWKQCPKCDEKIPADWSFHKDCGWRSDSDEDNKDKAKITLFTSPTCPHCKQALNLLREIKKERNDIKITELNTSTYQGSKKAASMGVMAVPTIFVKGPASTENIGFRGVPSKKDLLKAIDISLGSAKWEPPKKVTFKDVLKRIFSKE